jgi:hypothetical protein
MDALVSDPSRPTWENRLHALANTQSSHYFAYPSTMAFHDLCVLNQAPEGVLLLLGLSHKFCIRHSLPPTDFL